MGTRWAGVAIAAAVSALAGVAVAAGAGDALTVKALSVNLMSKPGLLAPRVGAPLDRGTQLTVVAVAADNNDWLQVKTADGRQGWLRRASVEDGAIKLSTKIGGEGGQVSKDEVEAAGRGFSKEVEAEYRTQNANLKPGYDALDKIEKAAVDPGKVAVFVKAGGLEENR